MEIKLQRAYASSKGTFGTLYNDKGEAISSTIEPSPSLSRHMSIKAGRYKCIWTKPGTHVYAPSDTAGKAPLLQSVKGRGGIFIHGGLTPAFSTGCIILCQDVNPLKARAHGSYDKQVSKGSTRTLWSDKFMKYLYRHTQGQNFDIFIVDPPGDAVAVVLSVSPSVIS
jgi:hypothetical protein